MSWCDPAVAFRRTFGSRPPELSGRKPVSICLPTVYAKLAFEKGNLSSPRWSSPALNPEQCRKAIVFRFCTTRHHEGNILYPNLVSTASLASSHYHACQQPHSWWRHLQTMVSWGRFLSIVFHTIWNSIVPITWEELAAIITAWWARVQRLVIEQTSVSHEYPLLFTYLL